MPGGGDSPMMLPLEAYSTVRKGGKRPYDLVTKERMKLHVKSQSRRRQQKGVARSFLSPVVVEIMGKCIKHDK